MRTVTSARAPVWADAANTLIDLFVTFEELADTVGEVPFSASSTATVDYEAAIYAAAVAGEYGAITAYAAPVLSAAQLADNARAWRDAEIDASQWLVERQRDQNDAGTATTLTAAQYSALLVYRQQLRDWPTATGFPADSTKPVAPDWLAGAEASADAVDTATA